MKHRELKRKIRIYSYIIIALLTILCFKLAYIQLLRNDIYQTQAKENRIRLLAIKAPRGEIYARDGETLAANELVYTLSLTFLGVSKQDLVVSNLVSLLQGHYPEVTADVINEKIEMQKYRLFEPVTIMRDIPWELVVKIEENRQDLPGVAITVEPLRYYPNAFLAGHVMGYIHSISPQELADVSEQKYNINSLIGKTGIEKAYEQQLRGKDGARRVEVDARGRPVGELVTLEPEPGNNVFLTLDMELQKVMEKSMEETLEKIQVKHPKAKVGSAVLLNVKTGEVLAMHSSPAMYPDDWKGELSDERASYYYPQGAMYDPLNPGAETNRALQVTYPPGSTFKPITGMAALEKGVMDSLTDKVSCRGSYWLAPYIKCWNVHGYVNYYQAMAGSCNTYFQEMGRRAGKDEIIRVAGEFGLGRKTGIDIPGELQGRLPTPEWKKDVNERAVNQQYDLLREELEAKYAGLFANAATEEEQKELEKQKNNEEARLEAQYKIDLNFKTTWQPFDTFNMSIGQGYNEFTVIQLANYCATIANGGYLMQPHMVSKVLSPDGKLLQEFKPNIIRETDITPETIAETKRAMLAVSQPGGTSHFLFYTFPEDIQVAAKTGTAETGRVGDNPKQDYHGVFIAFAPYDDPQIAFAGVVEYGYSGGESAGMVARDVFEQYFGLKDHLSEEDQNMTDSIGE